MVREGRVLISVATDPDFGSSYYVTAYETGAQVASGSASTTATVRAGHGFAANDKFLVWTGTSASLATYNTVTAVTSTTLTITAASLSAGDLLINLGPDTGIIAPLFDGSGAAIYTDMDYSNLATSSTVQTDANGKYRYYHKGIARWELVRSSATAPFALYTDTGAASSAVINVKDWGAVGDGTTDDKAAIQSALTSVASTGGSVYLPSGVYIVSDAVWIKSNTHVYGDGIDATTIKRQANSLSATVNPNFNRNPVMSCGSAVDTPYTNASSGTSISVSDLTIDGNYTNQTLTTISNGAFGFSSTHTLGADTGGCIDGLTLQRIKVTNIMQDGISIWNCRNVLVDSCVTYLTGQSQVVATKNAISLYGSPTDLSNGWCKQAIISNNRISYSGDTVTRAAGSASSEGIVNTTWDDVVIEGNDISFVDYGIELTYTTGAYTNYNCVIANNSIHDLTSTTVAPQIGIACGRDATRVLKGLTISGNTFYNINHNGMTISSVNGLTIVGNTLYKTNLDTDATYFVGIDVVTCTEVTCSGNSISLASPANGTYGMRLYGTTGSLASGNTITNDNASSTGANIILNVGCQNCLVIGNRLTGANWGIRISNSGTNSGNSLFGNYITGALTASVSDTSGQTNYNYGDLSAGAMTIPGHATVSGQLRRSASAAVTASTTHTQAGGTALTADINNVSVCANADDAVTLPTAVAGMHITVINSGAQNLRIWPASGDNLGTGVDTVRAALAAAALARFVAIDSTNWKEV